MIEIISRECVKMHRNDRELFSLVIYCSCMRLKLKEALAYLNDKGHSIGEATYYRIKKEIEASTRERLNLVASNEFLAQHLERIDILKMIQSELIENYKKETNPSKKSNILMQLAELQQYLSSYFDSTRYVMEQAAKIKPTEQQEHIADSAIERKKKKKKISNTDQKSDQCWDDHKRE